MAMLDGHIRQPRHREQVRHPSQRRADGPSQANTWDFCHAQKQRISLTQTLSAQLHTPELYIPFRNPHGYSDPRGTQCRTGGGATLSQCATAKSNSRRRLLKESDSKGPSTKPNRYLNIIRTCFICHVYNMKDKSLKKRGSSQSPPPSSMPPPCCGYQITQRCARRARLNK